MFGISLASAVAAKRISRDGSLMVGGRTYLTRMQKFYFVTETIAILTQTLTQPRYGRAALANITTQKGYYGTGYDGSAGLTSISKLDMQTNTQMSFSGSFSLAVRVSNSRASNNGAAGYIAGGYSGGYVSAIEKLTFSSESTSTISATLSQARAHLTSVNNDGVAMYSAGGETYGNPYTTPYANIDKMPYSTETRSTFYLPVALTDTVGLSNSGTAGYVTGGYYQYSQTQMNGSGNYYKWPFSTDTVSTVTSNQYFNGGYPNQFSRYAVAGYIVGGMDYANMKRVSFPTDTLSEIGNMPQKDDFVGPLTSSIGN